MTRGLLLSASIAALFVSAACTVDQSATPPVTPTGPSDFAQSVSITAIPDVVTLDGASQSSISVRVLGPNGQPANGVPFRVEILQEDSNAVFQVVDCGTLSTKSIVTGTDGRANAVYTAPRAFLNCVSNVGRVRIRAFALGNNAQTTLSYTTDIRLVSPGVILPPAETPTASFIVTPSVQTVGVPTNFDASASCGGPLTGGVCTSLSSIVSYAWTFGDGTSGSGQRVTHTYTSANTFSVTLTVTNDRGASASTTQVVTSGTSGLPSALFNFSPTQPAVGEPVFFNASASAAATGRTIASYSWAFGDGSTGSGVTTSHAYAAAGTYTVTLLVTDDLGKSVTASQPVAPGSPQAPQARFTVSPSAPVANQPALFVASTSTTAQGQTIVEYFWNFGDTPNCPPVASGGTPPSCYVRTTSATISHTFTTAGTYAVNLTVVDSAGRNGSTSQTVTIASVGATSPTPNFTFSPVAPGVNETVFFNASTSTAGAGHRITAYAWTFGDGTTATGVTTSHAYTTAGTYSVQLKVTDETGQSATTAATNITVGQPPSPTANFTPSPSNPAVGDPVTFDTAGTTTAQGQTIVRYDWNFGDGTPIVTCRVPAQTGDGAECTGGTNRTISHRYTAPNTYTINLVVTDSAGRTGTTFRNIIVGSGNPNASFTFVVTNAPTHTVAFDGSSSTSSGATTIVSYQWLFGDGLSASGAIPPPHSYAVGATYTVRLTVTDSIGRTGTSSQNVVVP